jgi:MoxR-like ATPase
MAGLLSAVILAGGAGFAYAATTDVVETGYLTVVDDGAPSAGPAVVEGRLPGDRRGRWCSVTRDQVTRLLPTAVLERTLFEVKRVVVGQDLMVERMLVGLLARGHVLLEGVPGVAKTLAVRTLADVVGGSFSRLQSTPDLMPADIVGTQVWRPSTETFDIELGPIFANLVLADEINRAPAKVQSALLEAMAERQVSIGGTTHGLPVPFLVLATQNPIETEGVYTLPEAQRDRFLLKVEVGHAEELDELAIVQRMSVAPPRAQRVLTLDELVALQADADSVFVHHAIAHYAVQLVMATRQPQRYGLALDNVGGVRAAVRLGAAAAAAHRPPRRGGRRSVRSAGARAAGGRPPRPGRPRVRAATRRRHRRLPDAGRLRSRGR